MNSRFVFTIVIASQRRRVVKVLASDRTVLMILTWLIVIVYVRLFKFKLKLLFSIPGHKTDGCCIVAPKRMNSVRFFFCLKSDVMEMDLRYNLWRHFPIYEILLFEITMTGEGWGGGVSNCNNVICSKCRFLIISWAKSNFEVTCHCL